MADVQPRDHRLPSAFIDGLGGDPVPDARRVARALRWIRLAGCAILLLLGATTWRDTWPMDGVSGHEAALVAVVWIIGTNLWSQAHDRRGRTDDGVRGELAADLLLTLALTVLGGTVVAEMPPLGIFVTIEAAARLRRREAMLAVIVWVGLLATAVLTEWPSWAGWSTDTVVRTLLPAAVGMPITLALVDGLAAERIRTRDVAFAQAAQLGDAADQLREANRRLAMANEELTAFAGRIAHDLRSPLGTVVTALQTLNRPELELDDETHAYLLAQALKAAERGVDTIGALLAHASAEGRAAEGELVDVGELAADVVATLPAELLGTIEVDVPREPALAWADRQLLPVVLQNLVTNALTHGGDGLGRIAVVTTSADGAMLVSVEDDGRGIPEEDREGVFAAGAGQGDRRGLGLGLATCESIVTRHGGRIWADASELGGAAIRFTLPWPPDQEPQPPVRRARVRRSTEATVDLRDGSVEDQRTLATSSSSGSSRATPAPSYRPGSAPTTVSTSRPASSAMRTSCGTV